jgi:putative aldouronate transport system permease protein
MRYSNMKNTLKINKKQVNNLIIYLFLIIVGFIFLLPLLLVLIGSFTDTKEIMHNGYSLFPKKLSLDAYIILLQNPLKILNAYKITISVTVLGTGMALFVTSLVSYALSRKELKYRNVISFFILFTMLFNGGMVSWYIITAGVFNLKDNIFALTLPYVANAWYIFLMRNFLKSIPNTLHDSALIDGAGEWRIYFHIILPLAKPGLVTIGLFFCVQYWNDWWLGLMLINDNTMLPLQLLLRELMSTIEFLSSGQGGLMGGKISMNLPRESVKLAMTVITTGPIILVYPFVQRFFVKGLIIGAIKG